MEKNGCTLRVGILYGKERAFPQALIDNINRGIAPGIIAEPVQVGCVSHCSKPSPYTVILDRISHGVPFYRSFLRKEALNGTIVLNNPFRQSCDDKLLNATICHQLGISVPRTVLLPTKDIPEDCSSDTFAANLLYPIDWPSIFAHIGFPCYLKQHLGYGWKYVYRCASEQEFWTHYDASGTSVMILQTEVDWSSYWRVFYCGGECRVMRWNPRAPHHLRYKEEEGEGCCPLELKEKLIRDTVAFNSTLGYDINTVEFAVSAENGTPYMIDGLNSAPDADPASVGEENFTWIVDAVVRLLVRKCRESCSYLESPPDRVVLPLPSLGFAKNCV